MPELDTVAEVELSDTVGAHIDQGGWLTITDIIDDHSLHAVAFSPEQIDKLLGLIKANAPVAWWAAVALK